MKNRLPSPAFWAGKRVLVTGHTGFKGSWLTLWLSRLGAEVIGLALPPEGEDNLFTKAQVERACTSYIVDLRDAASVRAVVKTHPPEIVLHLGAQALVRRSYADPAGTFATNVQGTVNLLDALADERSAKAILVVTSDKVYANDETGRAFVESDPLGGHDPYSLSKAACEHVVAAYRASRFAGTGTALATARGGNVIGGGDFSEDRIIPDIVRAAKAGMPVELRNPGATRPWQHVLDCLSGYLVMAEKLAEAFSSEVDTGSREENATKQQSCGEQCPSSLNIGPDPGKPISVGEIATVMSHSFGGLPPKLPDDLAAPAAMREMHALSLDPSRARALGIIDRLPGPEALAHTANWYRRHAEGETANTLCLEDIAAYEALLPATGTPAR